MKASRLLIRKEDVRCPHVIDGSGVQGQCSISFSVLHSRVIPPLPHVDVDCVILKCRKNNTCMYAYGVFDWTRVINKL